MKKKGFIQTIILIVGALVALKYFFDFDLIDLLTQGRFRDAWDWLVLNIWDKIIVDIIWTKASSLIKSLVD